MKTIEEKRAYARERWAKLMADPKRHQQLLDNLKYRYRKDAAYRERCIKASKGYYAAKKKNVQRFTISVIPGEQYRLRILGQKPPATELQFDNFKDVIATIKKEIKK